jgi:DNA-binding NarL/FixJ family response regulator
MRVLVIADTRFAAEMIQRALHRDAATQLVGCIDARTSCVEEVVATRPDVVVLDEMATPAVALARIAEARGAALNAKVVVLAARMEAPWLHEAVDAGADAAICKSLQPAAIAMLVRSISSGAVFHSFAARSESQNRSAQPKAGLTRREHQILEQVAVGASNGEIASRLCVTEQTVKFHLSNVYRKLGVSNRTQASRYAHMHRVVEPRLPWSPRREEEAA